MRTVLIGTSIAIATLAVAIFAVFGVIATFHPATFNPCVHTEALVRQIDLDNGVYRVYDHGGGWGSERSCGSIRVERAH